MATSFSDLERLRVQREPAHGVLIRSPRRWGSRVLLPLLILGAFLGLATWSSWELLFPGPSVTVTPVWVKQGIVLAGGTELFSAPGFIEPAPTPIEVPALIEGVVDRLLVLPGQRVEAGQVVATLIDAEYRLALLAAEEDLAERKQKVATAEADVAEAEAQLVAADVVVKSAELLVKDRAIGSVQYETSKAQRAVALARVVQAKARLGEAKVRVRQGDVARQSAELNLERTQVRSPASGVVMSLNVLPGRMVGSRTGKATGPEHVVTLYDPTALQVRVEVPMDKFQLVQPGQTASLQLDVAPDQRLSGVVLQDTHETNVDRNTVRVKVAVLPPLAPLPPQPVVPGMPDVTAAVAVQTAVAGLVAQQTAAQTRLRPGMIAKVRVFAPPRQTDATVENALRLFVPKKLAAKDGTATLWLYDAATGTAITRGVTFGQATAGDYVEVLEGLQPSDKLIASGREGLRPGQRVRLQGEE